jgi:hypothetical protein
MRAYVFSVIWFGLCALAVPAFSQPYGPPPPYGDRGVQPLDRLLPGIRREHPGDFYDAEGPIPGPSGDPHYHLKWMTPDGRVIWYDTDARSGRVLRSSPGRDSFDSGHGGPPPGYGRPSPGSFDAERYRGGPPPGYGQPYMGRGYGAPYGGGYGGPRFTPRFAPSSGWHGGGGGWRGGGGRGGRGGH